MNELDYDVLYNRVSELITELKIIKRVIYYRKYNKNKNKYATGRYNIKRDGDGKVVVLFD